MGDIAVLSGVIHDTALLITPKLWVAAVTVMTLAPTPDRTGWDNDVELGLVVTGPDGRTLDVLAYDDQGAATQELRVATTTTTTTTTTGWHGLALVGAGLPEDGSAFEIVVRYTAP
jgi:hypothetical protein